MPNKPTPDKITIEELPVQQSADDERYWVKLQAQVSSGNTIASDLPIVFKINGEKVAGPVLTDECGEAVTEPLELASGLLEYIASAQVAGFTVKNQITLKPLKDKSADSTAVEADDRFVKLWLKNHGFDPDNIDKKRSDDELPLTVALLENNENLQGY